MLNEQVRSERNTSQARKLKRAYENMLIFEQDRQRDKQERAELQKESEKQKMRGIALNFQQAQQIREKERDLKQAKFFHNELTKLVNKEHRKQNDQTAQSQFDEVGSELEQLEMKEIQMIESLQQTLNDHKKLQQMSSKNNLRVQSAKGMMLQSQTSFKSLKSSVHLRKQ